MNMLYFESGDFRARVHPERGLSLAIPQTFDRHQPSFFGAPPASRETLSADGFVGDTRRGGSCNVGRYHLVPHCNGTHTETLGHITDSPVPVGESLAATLIPLSLISLTPEPAGETGDSRLPETRDNDLLLTRDCLEAAAGTVTADFLQALAIRTLPNDPGKRTRVYDFAAPPPYFTAEAMRWLVEHGIEHLLVDMPSVDRMDDGGRLIAHHIFWQLPAGSRNPADAGRPQATITEMIHAPDTIQDGRYLLNLQLPAFMTDAAPSRPILIPLEPVQ